MDDTLNRHIGREVKLALWDSGATQQQLAAALGMEPSAVSRLLRGQRKWEFSEVLAVAEFLGVGVADLLPEPARQRLVSVGSGSARPVSRGRRTTGWFRRHVAKQRPPVLLAHEHNHPGLSPVSQVTPFPAPRRSPERLPADPYRRAG